MTSSEPNPNPPHDSTSDTPNPPTPPVEPGTDTPPVATDETAATAATAAPPAPTGGEPMANGPAAGEPTAGEPPAGEPSAEADAAAHAPPPPGRESEPLAPVGETSAGETPAAETPAAPPPRREPAVPPQPVPEVPPAPQPHDLSRIAQDLQIRKAQVEAVVQLLDDENTVPFITRYRKERTGGLNEDVIRKIQDRVAALRSLTDRKRTILKSIAFQAKLTDALTQAILAAETPKRLEDLYLPYKLKKKSKATEARDKGLGPVAEAIFNRDPVVANLGEVLQGLVDPDKWLLNTDDVLAGIKDILAEMVADSAEVRGPLRAFTWDTGVLVATRIETLPEGKGREYEPYFSFKEPVKEIPPHRVLAINRGEKGNVLRVRIDTDQEMAKEIVAYHLNLADHTHRELMQEVAGDSLDRLIRPALEREVRRDLTERAQEHAIMVFAKNLRSLLLQPPLRGKKVLAVDPGIRTGCKLAVLDETGKLLEDAVIYPQGQKKNGDYAKRKLEQLVRKHQISVIAIGNGTGCRDAEQLVADLIADLAHRRLHPTPETQPAAESLPTEAPAAPESPPAPLMDTAAPVVITLDHESQPAHPEVVTLSADMPISVMISADSGTPSESPPPAGETLTTTPPEGTGLKDVVAKPPASEPQLPPVSLEGLPPAPEDLAYVVVIEAGASDYSASPLAREEFPDLDATTRGTISIGRRLQDPLAELVKIDPQHIGVGLYQHDVKPKQLKESLEGVIESSVNQVGVELNTASVPLLRHVSGLNQMVAREIVNYREKNGPYTNRDQIRQVPGMGEKRFTQAAGFLKLRDGADPLDATWIHPESYPVARQVLSDFGFTPEDLRDRAKVEELRAKLNANANNLPEIAARLGVGEPTLDDIFRALARPGRDPREDLPPPIFKTGVLKLEDITPNMELKGTVLNVVPFGAFVDIGLKESGLVHISQMANRYIKSPYDVVSVGDVVTVWVMEVKAGEKKISLSMIPPGQERQVGGRGGRFAGPPRGERPPAPAPAPRPERSERPPLPPRPERPPFQPRGDRGGPPRGRGQGPGTPRPTPGTAPAPPQQPPPPPPRKPAKSKPLPNLTTEKRTGKAALNTFAELAAFFKPEPEKPKEEPKKEEKKPETQEKAPEKPPEPPPAEEPQPTEAPPAPEVQAAAPPAEEPKPDAPPGEEPK